MAREPVAERLRNAFADSADSDQQKIGLRRHSKTGFGEFPGPRVVVGMQLRGGGRKVTPGFELGLGRLRPAPKRVEFDPAGPLRVPVERHLRFRRSS